MSAWRCFGSLWKVVVVATYALTVYYVFRRSAEGSILDLSLFGLLLGGLLGFSLDCWLKLPFRVLKNVTSWF